MPGFTVVAGVPEMEAEWKRLVDGIRNGTLSSGDRVLAKKFARAISHLQDNPFHPGLQSHEIDALVAHATLRSQMIRAAMSIDANIAEGRGHNSDKELKRFLRISIASAYEIESHLIMGRDLRFLREADFVRLTEQLIEVRKMLFGLIKYLGSTRA